MMRVFQAVAAAAVVLFISAVGGHAQPTGFGLSYVAGGSDPSGQFAGGTELRLLVTHGGKLYAGNGYWEDRPGPEGRHGAQILVLDAPDARWRVDHSFTEPLGNRGWRDLAVGAMAEAVFASDGAGHALPQPARVLLASTWDLTGAARVFTRDDGDGAWTAVTLAQDRATRDFLPQIRSFGTHRDRVTGVDLVFAGDTPRGIFSGSYDASLPGRVRWADTPELGAAAASTGFSGLEGRLRVSSFAEANGRLYAAVGQQLFERVDGLAPQWRLVYTNPHPGHSETGLRGLTALPAANGQVLLAAVEGSAGRMVRIDPRTGTDTTELSFADFLWRAWGGGVGYTIAAYNDMTAVPAPGGEALLIGLMAFLPKDAPPAAGHRTLDVGYGQVEAGAWYLVRWPDGYYDLHQVTAPFVQPAVAVRTIRRSPFPGDGDALYFAGFDANKAPVHDTAWIARASLATVLHAPP